MKTGTVDKNVINTTRVQCCATDKVCLQRPLWLLAPLCIGKARKPLPPTGGSCLLAAAQLCSLASSQGLQDFFLSSFAGELDSFTSSFLGERPESMHIQINPFRRWSKLLNNTAGWLYHGLSWQIGADS